MAGRIARVLCCVLALLLASCVSHNYAPVEDLERPKKVTSGSHSVVRGDTLYSIAWRYGWDFRELARVNDIRPPYVIRPGQIIVLRSAPVANTPPRTTTASNPAPTARAASPAPRTAVPAAAGSAPAANAAATAIRWQWPARGRVVQTFDGNQNKGIDIQAALGAPVLAAADGEVVYAGSLVGYGNLVILKHNEVYLSAYAHNRIILVEEKKKVKAGDKIAEIGSTGVRDSKLHFEIRRNGQPVDPLSYLPKLAN